MTISELICRLQAIKCEHGDLLVAVPYNSNGAMKDAEKVEKIELMMSVKNSHLRVLISSIVNRKL